MRRSCPLVTPVRIASTVADTTIDDTSGQNSSRPATAWHTTDVCRVALQTRPEEPDAPAALITGITSMSVRSWTPLSRSPTSPLGMSNSAPSAPFFPGATIDARETTAATAEVTAARLVSPAPSARLSGQPGAL